MNHCYSSVLAKKSYTGTAVIVGELRFRRSSFSEGVFVFVGLRVFAFGVFVFDAAFEMKPIYAYYLVLAYSIKPMLGTCQ